MPPAEPQPGDLKPTPPPAGRVGRTYHLHLPFILYCAVSLLIAIGAFNSGNNLLFWLFALALSMLVVSGLVSGQMLMAVRLERERIESVHVGQRLIIRYRVTNRNRRIPVFSLALAEETKAPRADLVQPEGFIPHVPARSSVFAETSTPAPRRGTLALSTIRVISEFPFGIVRKSLTFTLPATAIIHAAPAPGAAARRRQRTARTGRHARAAPERPPAR
ncbi:MAG: hypothetical protein ACT4PL_13190, partial [Phycisphaerales bacterium]